MPGVYASGCGTRVQSAAPSVMESTHLGTQHAKPKSPLLRRRGCKCCARSFAPKPRRPVSMRRRHLVQVLVQEAFNTAPEFEAVLDLQPAVPLSDVDDPFRVATQRTQSVAHERAVNERQATIFAAEREQERCADVGGMFDGRGPPKHLVVLDRIAKQGWKRVFAALLAGVGLPTVLE